MDARQIEIYKKMQPHERVAVGCSLHDFAYRRLKAHLQDQMKGATDEMIQKELLKRFLGESAGIL